MRSNMYPKLLALLIVGQAFAKIDRKQVVRQFNPHRTASSETTPLQVGNGNFAFGAHITGLQTFQPFNTLSTWCWHNSTLPTVTNQTEPSDFTGLDWWTHDRLVNYRQPNPAEANISQWMIANPNRVNLGRVGLWFDGDVTESDLDDTEQTLDLYSGTISSSFSWEEQRVAISTYGDPDTSSIAVEVNSALLGDGSLGIFFDFPYMIDDSKFEAPFIGLFNATENHTTTLEYNREYEACIKHEEDGTVYYTTVHWSSHASLEGPLTSSHRYLLKPHSGQDFAFTVSYHDSPSPEVAPFYSPNGQGTHIRTDVSSLKTASSQYWADFWENGAFLDLTRTGNSSAIELQRRVIQSHYLAAVNEADFDPPQESGLVNNGWYGKFHAEMWLWHLGHWGRWDRWELQNRAVPGVYDRFLATSIERAQRQGYEGARWGKMSDSTGRSAPGEINSLLIWQQPHPMHFAEYEWRAFPNNATLEKWDSVLHETAVWMADYAFWNESTGVYDLGPPMYPVSENTDPNATFNAAFELAYWRFGLDIAAKWKTRQGQAVPAKWSHVADHLAPLPTDSDDTYIIYEGIPDMWNNDTYTEDHQSMLGIYGWLPPQPGFDLEVMQNTVDHVYGTWNFTYSYGWDFPLLAMNAARMGEVDRAVDWLLDPTFEFDDAGYHVGGPRVPTPYIPGAASLLWAMAMLAGGWDGREGSQLPDGWDAEVEGFLPAL